MCVCVKPRMGCAQVNVFNVWEPTDRNTQGNADEMGIFTHTHIE